MTDFAPDKPTLAAVADFLDRHVIEIGKLSDEAKAKGSLQEMYGLNHAWHEVRVLADVIRAGQIDGELDNGEKK